MVTDRSNSASAPVNCICQWVAVLENPLIWLELPAGSRFGISFCARAWLAGLTGVRSTATRLVVVNDFSSSA